MALAVEDRGDFVVLSKIGGGTFSNVYHVKRKDTGKDFAMKELIRQFESADEFVHHEEIELMQRIGVHPNIVSVRSLIFEPEEMRASIVVDLMEKSLLDYISARRTDLTVREVLVLGYQMLDGLAHIHSKGLMHRDFKPDNVFVNPGKLDIKIGDFGSAGERGSTGQASDCVATRWYRAPECLLRASDYGPEIDIWACGCTIAEMVLGRPLFPGKDAIDQLNRIHRMLGTPNDELLTSMYNGAEPLSAKFLRYPPQKLGYVFRGMDEGVLDLLSQLLMYAPSERINAERALHHPAFERVLDEDGDLIKASAVGGDEPLVVKPDIKCGSERGAAILSPPAKVRHRVGSVPAVADQPPIVTRMRTPARVRIGLPPACQRPSPPLPMPSRLRNV